MCIPGVPIPGPVMFFIFGFPEFDSNIKKYEGVKLHCDRCNNDSMEAIRHRRFFSMFWIPFLPLHFSKRIKCTICGSFRDVSKSEIDQLFKR
ncbi:hypothetical protein PP7435_CHR2-1649 [Komagataella phaffii CBS 7435]|uniref:Zinc-ribbon 15 domain-containing protein n=2 Tax=Komagataella phaffii TaxID=460519 RepID=C4R2C8_KOMPG|nr:Hypothetical protein PAS_chr2-2_0262 [Komagataella phaffii GS115]CAH2447796.1 hypothetical protein BQ9382_C2-1505 [Komagataella phaffii CBS 7435]CAY69652.1 Hypothetical protein PAS_chr2-2_0262 [Komagataella phaffii GS115]SCV11995.1 hypothetical protein PP7435_CHR2-1649 [Komagataella phaffii CBS 7435]